MSFRRRLGLVVASLFGGLAVLIKSGLLTSGSGSIGGATLSHNRGGLYFRSRTIPADPLSQAQVGARAAMAECSVAWSDVLSQAQRDAWNLYAQNVPLPNPLGDPVNVGGIGMFVRSNVTRLIAGQARIDAAPTVFEQGTPIAAGAQVTADAGLQEITTSLGPMSGTGVAFISVQQGRPVNPGVLYFDGPWQLLAFNAFADFPVTSPNPPFAFASGQRLFVRIRSFMTDGRVGPPVNRSTLVA